MDEHQLSTSINNFDFSDDEKNLLGKQMPEETSDDNQHLSENVAEEAFQMRKWRGMI